MSPTIFIWLPEPLPPPSPLPFLTLQRYLRMALGNLLVMVVVMDGPSAMPLMNGVLGLEADLPCHHGRWLEVGNMVEGPEPRREVIATYVVEQEEGRGRKDRQILLSARFIL